MIEIWGLNIKYMFVCCLVGYSCSTCSLSTVVIKDEQLCSFFDGEVKCLACEKRVEHCRALGVVFEYDYLSIEEHSKSSNDWSQSLLAVDNLVFYDFIDELLQSAIYKVSCFDITLEIKNEVKNVLNREIRTSLAALTWEVFSPGVSYSLLLKLRKGCKACSAIDCNKEKKLFW